ncbi:MAG: indolepyruvate ferredoxin oxidoreductase subunit alpha [Desulfovibrio sp.]|nr:MAG: indolepyruvate ferredoxin oxidoreductase subunit alpha [Desulfovibrio sp.]
MASDLLTPAGGERHLLLGNEAIVRGALEGGVQFVSCYPGTPSSEAPDTFYRLSPKADYYFEYSVNEKVALEVGGGAAVSGLATMVTMKHVGVNVAADPLMTLTYIGAPGGLVLLSADDPGCHSSQNEQDNRYYARLAGMPVFEPSTAQEAKDMARDAFKLSRESEQPVMLRTTTRVNHLRGPVDFGPLPEQKDVVTYSKNPRRFVPVPVVARMRRLELLKKLEELREIAENSPWNKVSGSGKLGIITSGITRAYVNDALDFLGLRDQVMLLELGMSYPLPEKTISEFLGKVSRVMILEELEPVLETEIRALVQRLALNVEVAGKMEGFPHLPRNDEYSTVQVGKALQVFVQGQEGHAPELCAAEPDLPMRPPNLCAGCSHRALYYSVRQVFGPDVAQSSDIGCYTLGILPPLAAADFLLCMGSSISAGSGAAKGIAANKDSQGHGLPVLAFIGDSTFFHSGITGIVNAVFNRHDILVVVLDNGTTAMTGHQPHPGVLTTMQGDNPAQVDIEAIVKGCGVDQVRTVSPFNLNKTQAALEELKEMSGVRVLIAREPCVLFARRALRKTPKVTAYVAEQGPEVEACLEKLACPAFYRDGSDVAVDAEQCTGCMVCSQITNNIKARKRS